MTDSSTLDPAVLEVLAHQASPPRSGTMGFDRVMSQDGPGFNSKVFANEFGRKRSRIIRCAGMDFDTDQTFFVLGKERNEPPVTAKNLRLLDFIQFVERRPATNAGRVLRPFVVSDHPGDNFKRLTLFASGNHSVERMLAVGPVRTRIEQKPRHHSRKAVIPPSHEDDFPGIDRRDDPFSGLQATRDLLAHDHPQPLTMFLSTGKSFEGMNIQRPDVADSKINGHAAARRILPIDQTGRTIVKWRRFMLRA